ncbi:MAG: four helix bundle protein [Saprospiraceae bacterium]|nr:four helix bundle protein [Saprospiraceae bacterium]
MKTTAFYSFERLTVWQRSCSFAADIYQLTKRFPKEELYGISSQLRRASISISSNIAEGSSRKSGKEQGRFTEIAYGSLLEVISQLKMCVLINLINEDVYVSIRSEGIEIGKMLSKLRSSQLSR